MDPSLTDDRVGRWDLMWTETAGNKTRLISYAPLRRGFSFAHGPRLSSVSRRAG
jgi:hypothetical protein